MLRLLNTLHHALLADDGLLACSKLPYITIFLKCENKLKKRLRQRTLFQYALLNINKQGETGGP